MKLKLIVVGKTKFSYARDGEELYGKRLKRYVSVETIVLRDGKGTSEAVMREEGRRIMEKLDASDFVVVLDERGKTFKTADLAKKMSTWRDQNRTVVFVVGGAWGLADEVRQRADLLWSLSPMTFPHELARVVLMEQLYRIFTVLRGEPYHH